MRRGEEIRQRVRSWLSAPASARAAAARTLLDELNRRGKSSDRRLSALSVAEMEAELSVGETGGRGTFPWPSQTGTAGTMLQ